MFPKARKAAWLLTLWSVLGVCALVIVRSNLSASAPREISLIPKDSDIPID